MARTGYALSRILIARMDSGGKNFNYPEVLGNLTSGAISMSYYPRDERNVSGVSPDGLPDWLRCHVQRAQGILPDIHQQTVQALQVGLLLVVAGDVFLQPRHDGLGELVHLIGRRLGNL